jgi:2-dehydropantoate 2-reductase
VLHSISERVTKLKELFEKAHVKVELFEDIRVGIWHKFMLICAVSGVGAITRAPLGGTPRPFIMRTMTFSL